MRTTVKLPVPSVVGTRAAEILIAVELDGEFCRLRTSSLAHAACWASFIGYPVVALWNLDADKSPLFDEAVKALCLKAAVYELTRGDETAAELPVSLPVDEMIHAVLAQHNIMTGLQLRLGVLLPHMTDLVEFGWEPDDYTSQCYAAAAGWGEMNPRYWVGTGEAKRRLGILDQAYSTAGLHDRGRRHEFMFAADDLVRD